MRNGIYSVHQMHVHLVWITKYRYEVLRGDIQMRCRVEAALRFEFIKDANKAFKIVNFNNRGKDVERTKTH